MAFYQIGIINFGFHVHIGWTHENIFKIDESKYHAEETHHLSKKMLDFVYKMKKCHKKQWGSNNPVFLRNRLLILSFIFAPFWF